MPDTIEELFDTAAKMIEAHEDYFVSREAMHSLARKVREKGIMRCQNCGKTMEGRSDSKYCSARCRVAAHRRGKANPK